MFSIPGLADLARKNQRLITVAQYLVGASSLLVPSRSEHYEVYTEASYSLSQLISFCNSVILDNGDSNGTSANNQSTSNEVASPGTGSLRVLSNSVRSLDYYLWVVTRVITHLEVLLEKAAGALWGDSSKERSILILAIESLKAMSRLFVLLSVPKGKQTMILNWSKAYVSREDSLDLSHYKLWYKVQHDRIRSQNTHTANISNRIARQKSEINNGFDGTDSENLTVSTACSEGAFSTPFVGRRSGLVLNYTTGQDLCASLSKREREHTAISAAISTTSTSSTLTATAAAAGGGGNESESESALEWHIPPDATPSSSPCTSSSPNGTTPLSRQASSLSTCHKKNSSSTYSFHSSFSGVTDSESTTSTDSATEQNHIRDIDQNCENALKNDSYFPENEMSCSPQLNLELARISVQNTIYNNYCNNYDVIPDTSNYHQGSREEETGGEREGRCDNYRTANRKNENYTSCFDDTENGETKSNRDNISVISSADYIPPKSVNEKNYDSSDDSNITEMCENSCDNIENVTERREELLVSDDEERKDNDVFEGSKSSHRKSLKMRQNNEDNETDNAEQLRNRPLIRCDNSTNINKIKQKINKEEYPFTADQALFVSEILYVLRPLVLAWGTHYIKERRRKRNMEKQILDIQTNQNNVENGEKSSGINSTENDVKAENTLFNTMEDFFPLLLSLAVEVLSIRLTTIALTMAREGETGEKSEKEGEKEREEGVAGRVAGREGNNAHSNAQHSACNNSSSNTHTAAPKTRKLTEHKWDLELSRRKLLLLYYLVRGQTFNRATLPLLQMASEFLKYVPIVNSLPSYAINMLSYLNRSHFRSSSSS